VQQLGGAFDVGEEEGALPSGRSGKEIETTGWVVTELLPNEIDI